MNVDGYVKMSISMNVIDLETESCELDKWGHVIITDPDKFFMDWVDAWTVGQGELSGSSDEEVRLRDITDYEES